MRITLIFLWFLVTLTGFAHQHNQAYFDITVNDGTTTVKATFPWSIRDALIELNPDLDSAASKEDFQITLQAYIRKKLVFYQGDRQLDLTKVKVLPKEDHHEQYQFKYLGNATAIENSILITKNKKHVNYHVLHIQGEKITFKLNHEKKHFSWATPKNDSKDGWDYLQLVSIIAVFATLLLLIFRNRILGHKS